MKIDIVSVFPEYFDVLNLSLFGKAQAKGLVEVHAHNLRDWTHDVHHSVDDTPVGGGAGMVMKPAVWAECLDELLGIPPEPIPSVVPSPAISSPAVSSPASPEPGNPDTDTANAQPPMSQSADSYNGNANKPVDLSQSPDSYNGNANMLSDLSQSADSCNRLSEAGAGQDENGDGNRNGNGSGAKSERTAGRTVLIFPNPSAPLFTQRDATELSHADRLVFGCGRYEGYDARIPEYYRAQGVDVREYSIGDYVLNGGEVAVSVMLEAITRLMPGFMGNPESIVEESYTGGNALLEHRQYTKPAVWRGMEVPEVLLSGDHGKVDRFRRDEALARTDEIRPDLIERLDCRALDKADRKMLMALGWEVSGEHPRRLGTRK